MSSWVGKLNEGERVRQDRVDAMIMGVLRGRMDGWYRSAAATVMKKA
jgi:hypothetical protein